MRCLVIDSNGFLVDVSPQPATFDSCSYVVQSGAEVVASPFALDLDDAGLLAGAVTALWAVAYVFRLLRRQLEERI